MLAFLRAAVFGLVCALGLGDSAATSAAADYPNRPMLLWLIGFVYAFASLKLRRTRFALPVSRPRAARQGKAWWARQDSNLQPDRYERPALTIELQARRAAAGAAGNGADTPYNAPRDPAMAAR